MSNPPESITILGAGSWGSALAIHLAACYRSVRLWDHDRELINVLRRERINSHYLPGIIFPENIAFFDEISTALSSSGDILIAVSSQFFRSIIHSIKPFISGETRILWATKGIDPEKNQLFHQTTEEILGKRPMAVLSGPSFAVEAAKKQPTVVAIASNNESFGKDLVEKFNQGTFRVYLSSDLIGVQIGGAVKNVIAIAVGMSDGLGFGANAKSGLITRGLAEIMRLGLAMGAKQETFMGLSGLGDLVLTCTDNHSRNRRFGLGLAEGKSKEAVEKEIGQVVEGIHTVNQVVALAKQYQVDMPISFQVLRILSGEVSAKQAVNELLARKPKSE